MEGATLPQHLSPTALQGWRLHLARSGWLLVAASLLILYVVQLDEHWRNFQANYFFAYLAVSWRYWALLRLLRLFASTAGMSALVLLFLVFPDGRFAPHWMKWALVPLALMVVIGTLGLETLAWTGITWEALMGSLLALLALAVAAQIYRSQGCDRNPAAADAGRCARVGVAAGHHRNPGPGAQAALCGRGAER